MRSGRAGWGGQFPGDPPLPVRFIYKLLAPGQKGASGGDTAAPGRGFGLGPRFSGGAPSGKALFSRSVPPRHKAGAGSAGSARLSIPTFGV